MTWKVRDPALRSHDIATHMRIVLKNMAEEETKPLFQASVPEKIRLAVYICIHMYVCIYMYKFEYLHVYVCICKLD